MKTGRKIEQEGEITLKTSTPVFVWGKAVRGGAKKEKQVFFEPKFHFPMFSTKTSARQPPNWKESLTQCKEISLRNHGILVLVWTLVDIQGIRGKSLQGSPVTCLK